MGELMGFREAVSRLVLSVTTDDDPELADAARRVSQLIEHGWIDQIEPLQALNAELLAANAADESPQLIAGLESLVDELEKTNAELLAACKAAMHHIEVGELGEAREVLFLANEEVSDDSHKQ